jgi:hypothetical protein
VVSESTERLEHLRERFLEALHDLSGGAGVGTALVSDIGQQTGLDPEGNPEDRALCERLASELVEAGYATAEVGVRGMLGITAEGERALDRGEALPTREFGEMRQLFLRAALEAAEEAGGGPSSSVRLRRVAEKMGVDLSGDVGPILTKRYVDMASYYQDLGYITDWHISEGKFRLTARGIETARGREG